MTSDRLFPSLDLLRKEYVLVQAWKKTARYIRAHNWYADTLELDWAAINLPAFIARLQNRLKRPEEWRPSPLRLIPAPKSQPWIVRSHSKRNVWEPDGGLKATAKLRPLAHVSLEDQVLATAVMMCLADRVETLQGDPRDSIEKTDVRKRTTSYGNRLFCDGDSAGLRHRWGSTKLYRAYYQDYQKFITRPEIVAQQTTHQHALYVVHSDLQQFYDRVRPDILGKKLDSLLDARDEPEFFALAKRLLSWTWDDADRAIAEDYASRSDISDFEQVALPQGLVAAGFFANVVLLDFDKELRAAHGTNLWENTVLEDACRYVDDLRLVLCTSGEQDLHSLESEASTWLDELLHSTANGLASSKEKTHAALFHGEERPLVRQSRKMRRIQRTVSGGFDAAGGEEVLDSILGLIQAQQRYSQKQSRRQRWDLAPVPDVRDDTVARFAANRYRTTYRSLRPLLLERDDDSQAVASNVTEISEEKYTRVPRTQSELDDDARAFALGLVEQWVEDPSNVRLLRVALDLWPDVKVLDRVVELLKGLLKSRRKNPSMRLVAAYCLAEVFRAGATETGLVSHDESLPTGVDLNAYRRSLRNVAQWVVRQQGDRFPWYLRQQAMLFLIATRSPTTPKLDLFDDELDKYVQLLRFLGGSEIEKEEDLATLAVLSRRSILNRADAEALLRPVLTSGLFEEIAARDPEFAYELYSVRGADRLKLSERVQRDLGILPPQAGDRVTVRNLVLEDPRSQLRNELSIVSFAIAFLRNWQLRPTQGPLAPPDVIVRLAAQAGGNETQPPYRSVSSVEFAATRGPDGSSLYSPPPWIDEQEHWRFQLGCLIRFILTQSVDFTSVVRPHSRQDTLPAYRPPRSHWYQRIYGLYNEQSSFGDDWLPISEWVEQFLLAILRWPGCGIGQELQWACGDLGSVLSGLERREAELRGVQGTRSGTILLPLNPVWERNFGAKKSFRICVVQTVLPRLSWFRDDHTLSKPAIRKEHRNHLASALAAVERMLELRETHEPHDGRLDLLVLPELAVHPDDVRLHLERFCRAYKAIVLAGVAYQRIVPDLPSVNSALWLIPQWTEGRGLHIVRRRQGKGNLAPEEQRLNSPTPVVREWRPVQWLVNYRWKSSSNPRPMRMTASVCYDATDIRFVADIGGLTDLLVVPALNKDVGTFDKMAEALHYHLYQLVLVANSGEFGGSNAYAPFKDSFKRAMFHLHGQPQAAVSFIEIDDMDAFLSRVDDAKAQDTPSSTKPPHYSWKYPPAGR